MPSHDRELFEPLDGVDEHRPILAVDIGGTKLAVGVVSHTGQVLERAQVVSQPTGSGQGDALFRTASSGAAWVAGVRCRPTAKRSRR